MRGSADDAGPDEPVGIDPEDRLIEDVLATCETLYNLDEFVAVDGVLAKLDPATMPDSVALAWLAETFAVRDRLPNRPALVDRVERYMVGRHGKTKAHRLMKGLRGD